MQVLKNTFFLIIGLALVIWSFYSVLQKPAPAKYQATNQQLTTDGQRQAANNPGPTNLQLRIGKNELQVEVVSTDAERTLGLSGRNELPKDTGMLFVFPISGNHGIWMKEMNFPIDIVWLDEAKKVVHIEREVRPETFPYVFYPKASAKYVLELANARSFDLGIDIGVELFFNLKN